ncbi:MAG: hypothetical protein ACOY0T_05505 [Myxococcota bacterium]
MKERRLRVRLGLIAQLVAPLSLTLPIGACGGAAETGSEGGASQGGDTNVAGKGGTSAFGGSAGSPSGGSGTGGSGTGGWSAGGTGTGGSGNGGSANGGTGTGGSGTGGSGTGGTGKGGSGSGGTGGTVNCTIQGAAGFSPDCVSPHYYNLPAACSSTETTIENCKAMCKTTWLPQACWFMPSSQQDTVVLACPPTCVAGRRPAGFVESALPTTGFSAYLSRSAELEAAAIPAFRRLRAELHERGAPRSLLRALSRAARDERRHARATSALARRHGARVTPPKLAAREPRSLEAIAMENVAEGCVRELYGALVATYQAEHAHNDDLRRMMKRIAHEETRHAALSMKVQTWLESRLDPAARARVRAARQRAMSELAAELDHAVDPALAEAAGLPTRVEAARLYQGLLPLMLA